MKRSRALRARRLSRAPHVAVSIAGVATLALVACSEPLADRACTSHATLIPAYLPPAELTELLTGPDRTGLVVVNPDNGPGAALNPAYADAIGRLRRTGTRVLGYVATGYASRDPELVRTEVRRYASWYAISDIFVDEVAAGEEALPYYTALSAALRARTDGLVVLNPGRVPARGYFDIADIVVTFEGPFSDYRARTALAPSWAHGLFATRTAHQIYAASDQQALEAVETPLADYVYANSATLPNPWRTLPSSLTEQQARLARC